MRERQPHLFPRTTVVASLAERRTLHLYRTPAYLAAAALALVSGEPRSILDPGAGEGAWGQAARRRWPEATITGVEIRDVIHPPEYDVWLPLTDFTQARGFWSAETHCTPGSFDLVIGNPPFRHGEAFVRRSLSFARPDGGQVLHLLPLGFLASQGRGKGLWREHRPEHVTVICDRPSFFENGRTDRYDYAFYQWEHGGRSEATLEWMVVAPSALPE
jgi:hypothetical protein